MIDTKLKVQEKINQFRTILRLLDSPEFHECITLNPDDPKILTELENGNVDFVKHWLKTKIKSQVTEYSARQLRRLAVSLGIPRYTHMKKHELLAEIIRVQRLKRLQEITKIVPRDQEDFDTFVKD